MTFPVARRKSPAKIAPVLVCLLTALSAVTQAQRRHPFNLTTGYDDVVFAIAFSPDGHTLAIARGAAEPAQRFGRIELWDTELGTLRHVIKGFDGPVRSVSFSPDGATLVSGSTEYRNSKINEKALSRYGDVFGEVKWWNSITGELKNKVTLPGEGNFSISATYSPDGKHLAIVESFLQYSLASSLGFGLGAASASATDFARARAPSVFRLTDVKVLDAETGEQQLKLDAGSARRAIFSPDGRFLALENGNEIKLWDVQTGKQEHKLKGLKGQLSSIAFSPDGQSLAVAVTRYHDEPAGSIIRTMGDSEVRLFDVNTWAVTRQLSKIGAVRSLAFAPGGRVLLIGGMISINDDAIPGVKLWDLSNGNSANLPTGGEDFTESVDSLVLTHSGTLLALKAGSATVKMVDTHGWQVKQTFDETSVGAGNVRSTSRFVLSVRRVIAVAFSADGNTLSGELEQGEIKLWDHRTGEVKKQLAGDKEAPSLVAVAAEGAVLAEVSNGSLRVWDAGSDTKRSLPQPDGGSISAIALSADGRTLAVSAGKSIRLLSVAGGEVLQSLNRRQTAVDRIAFSRDNGLLAVADKGGAIEIWNLASGQLDKTISTTGKVTALRFAPNGQTLASAGEDLSIAVWTVATGLQEQTLRKHSATINALAFSADGQLLASGSDDRTVVVWELASGKSKHKLKGQNQTVTALAFSPDGTLLASAGGDASVVVWEVRKGNVNRVLR